jgi:hypothetical protein
MRAFSAAQAKHETLDGSPRLLAAPASRAIRSPGRHYKWIALSNTTLGVLMATINASILLIALPVSVMFAALLGYNPVQTLLGPAIAKLPASHAAYLTGRSFFPALISPAFSTGLSIAFDFAIAACLIAAFASLLRGKRYVHEEHGADAAAAQAADPVMAEAG